ncbi:DUF1553 domain-containing protein [Pleomorphovibrio marinus]|uniref:DUF1553 domain-containing protein n=1 Tax=Pleomorphovibrio marinus TaxID=2164132 RepID=UPI000E0B7547|nr:DUF1553 domain-containing protein [Pleomorphovibrio marinus]
MKKGIFIGGAALIGLFFLFWGMWGAQLFQDPISYNQHIRPIVNNKCIACHGGVKQSGGFSLLFEEEAKAPTESGKPAIIPGKAKDSEMVSRLTHHDAELRMPYGREPLSEDEIELITKWIDQGAKWEEHWAYSPPKKDIPVPKLSADWEPKNQLDHFIFTQLEAMGLPQSPEAEKEVLLRRLYLDLVGLPPTLEDYERFSKSAMETAYEEEVDRLLDLPQFGEKWASFWLDLARYADSKGYEKDLHRSIWKYRDWVIDAFNADMGFDAFTIAQLAGDLLPNPSEADLIATAFHRNTMANDEGGTNDEEFRVAAVMERVGTTYEVWQSTTMACVQCHSHPYDPIRHEDFFRSMAIFNNTADKDLYNEQPKLLTYEDEDKEKVRNALTWINRQVNSDHQLENIENSFLHQQKEKLLYQVGYRKVEAEEFQDKSRFIELVGHDQKSIWQVQDSSWVMYENVELTDISSISLGYASLTGAKVEIRLDEPLGEKIGEGTFGITAKNFPANRPQNWEGLTIPVKKVTGHRDVYLYFQKDKTFAQDLVRVDWLFFHLDDAPYKKLSSDIQDAIEDLYEIEAVHTPIFQELEGEKQRQSFVFARGDWRSPDEEVEPGLPAILGDLADSVPPRLAFAHWLVHPNNPLTARVMVNRIWEQIFGFGLIETMEDFGSQGFEPTHPELLDWLAIRFIHTHNWSMKSLIKEILMSATYRQSSHVTDEALEKDPYNKYLSRGSRTRLPSETLRDKALAISGLLVPERGGPSVMPYQPEGLRDFSGVFWHQSEGKDKYRRAIYTYWKRTNPYPSMATFDNPSREVCTSRRIRTNTPLQSLVLLNDPAYIEMAEAFASKIHREHPEDIEKGIATHLQLITAVPPAKEKVKVLTSLYQEALDDYQTQELAEEEARHLALTLVCNAMFNLDEFINRR